jgi:hypothetical protein
MLLTVKRKKESLLKEKLKEKFKDFKLSLVKQPMTNGSSSN